MFSSKKLYEFCFILAILYTICQAARASRRRMRFATARKSFTPKGYLRYAFENETRHAAPKPSENVFSKLPQLTARAIFISSLL